MNDFYGNDLIERHKNLFSHFEENVESFRVLK